MKIKSIVSQHRRDFTAVYACEHCGHEHTACGYDDSYFHNTVVPDMACPSCHKKAGDAYEPLEPKHPDGAIL